MNLALLDPFAVAQEYPETLTQTLSHGHSVCIEYNNKGVYLASGLADGSIVIFDQETSGVVTVLKEHTRPIQSLSWSLCGRYLLSSSRDWKVNLWDLATKTVLHTVKFDGPVWVGKLHPKNHLLAVAALFEDKPMYIDFTRIEADTPYTTVLETLPLPLQDEDSDEGSRKKQKTEKHMTLVACFHPSGEFVFTGTSKGWLNVFSTRTLAMVYSIKVANSNIKHIMVSTLGKKIGVNCSDRVIRQYQVRLALLQQLDNGSENGKHEDESDSDSEPLELDHKFQDVVNKLQWNAVSFNFNAEYVIASTYGSAAHDVYMWETSMGSLVKILEGPKEELVDVAWNYNKCAISATGIDSGTIYVWSIVIPQKWSALAPDFVEIEENIEYEESEDEFDIVPDEEINQRLLNEEDEEVDILTRETVDARGFSMAETFVIPVDYEVDYGDII
ncbi:hypothetical protein BABINDRAFT_172775 [Babjeviella inositovora NRRL Y-12698]|uniref:Uncharacterized protein n=1 Tax=Babjeviella inositovora NRRL Y-12698 TaxID=984486 RepID=A0A1E3QJ74_9ASCO|nr:uncharacterized protein BABINDRAFT_172775 [Babjeviella inositovora NRRL Y-12698]ODQ77729.1 hypothetical protein BABINDRAFT_172775 [Babjeviella inositovora NRRL Y-12698]